MPSHVGNWDVFGAYVVGRVRGPCCGTCSGPMLWDVVFGAHAELSAFQCAWLPEHGIVTNMQVVKSQLVDAGTRWQVTAAGHVLESLSFSSRKELQD